MDNKLENSAVPTLGIVIGKLEEEKLLDKAGREKIENGLTSMAQKISSPWFIQALIAMAAWWAAIFFLIFMFGTNMLKSKESMIGFGVFFCIGAVALRRIFHGSIFADQLALALNVAGQIMFCIGISQTQQLLGQVTTIALIVIGLQIVMFFAYGGSIQCFAAPIVSTGCLLVIIFDLRLFWLTHILIAVLAILAGYLWLNESHLSFGLLAEYFQSLSYGIVASLLSLLVMSIMPVMPREFEKMFPPQDWWISTIILYILLMVLEVRILQENKAQITSSVAIVAILGTVAFTLLCLKSPGLIAALGVLILGFHRGNRILMGLALLFLCNFLFFYYYNMQITLLTKSLILMGTGLVLLGMRLFLVRLTGAQTKEA